MIMLTMTNQMKAVKHFKRLIDPSKEETPMQSILGQEHESHFVQPPMEMEPEESFADSAFNMKHTNNETRSLDILNRRRPRPVGRDFALNGLQRQQQDRRGGGEGHDNKMQSSGLSNEILKNDFGENKDSRATSGHTEPPGAGMGNKRGIAEVGGTGTRGHARDPLEQDFPYLFIGPSTFRGGDDKDKDDSIKEEPEKEDSSEAATTKQKEEEEKGATTAGGDGKDNNDEDYGYGEDEIVVSESPIAAEFDIYETAYRQQIENIRDRALTRRTSSKVYLTRRVEGKDHVKKLVEGIPQQEKEEEEEKEEENKQASSSSSSSSSSTATALNPNPNTKRRDTPLAHPVGLLMKAQVERHRQRSQQVSDQNRK